MQADRRFSKDKNFIFLLFNQLLRHTASRSIGLKVKDTKKSLEAVLQIITNTDFFEKLQVAKTDPEGLVAKQLVNAFMPHVQMAGAEIPYSPLQRKHSFSELIAYVRHFGPPNLFVTINVLDSDSKEVIDYCRGFKSETYPDETIRKQMVCNDPIASALIFNRQIENILSILIGILITYYRIATRIFVKS